jgi:DNA end-binding protein Ku
MPRAMWKGRLQLALVSCGVKLFSALTAAEQIHFHILNRATTNRINLVPHDAETGEEVPRAELVKGFEYDKGHYLVVDPAEIEKLRPERNKVIEIESFADVDKFDVAYCDRPYYLAPDGPGAAETYAVIRAALAERGRIGLGRMVLQTRERSVALEPHGEGLVMSTLLAKGEVRDDAAFFDEIGEGKLDPEMVDLAALIIRKKVGPLDLGLFRDRYQERLRELVEAKVAGRTYVVPKEKEPAKIIDLKEALRRAVSAEGGEAAPTRAAAGDKPRRAAAKTQRRSTGGKKRAAG